MLNAATLRTRHRMLPNPRRCTLTPKSPDGASFECTGYRRPWTQDDVKTFGAAGIEPEHSIFLLATETLNGVVPQGGWLLVDDEGSRWTLLGRTGELEGAMYRCPVIKQV